MFRRKQTSQPPIAPTGDGRPNAFTILPGVPAPRGARPVVEAETEAAPETELAPVPVAEPPAVQPELQEPTAAAQPVAAVEPAPAEPPPAEMFQPQTWAPAEPRFAEQASVVAPDPSSPVLDGSFVEADEEPLRPAFVGAARPTDDDNDLEPSSAAPRRRLPDLPDHLSERVAEQVAAEYAARELAAAAPQSAEPAVLPTPPLPEALLPMVSRVAEQVAAEHAARRVETAADQVEAQPPSVGLVFADGSYADLADSPELSAFQQAAGALTAERQRPPAQ